MAQFTITFNTGSSPLSRITDAFQGQYKSMYGLPEETNAQLTNRMIKNFIINTVKNHEMNQAQSQISLTPFDLT